MLVVSSPQELADFGPVALAVGAFDALHRGHQSILAATIAEAKRTHAHAAVLYFEPSPKQVLHPDNAPKPVFNREYRQELLEFYGIEAAIVMPFTQQFAALSPQEFLEKYILPRSGAVITAICVGDDWRFGARNCGDAQLLCRLLENSGVAAKICPQIHANGEPISTTRIRQLIAQGDLSGAGELLGRPYAIRSRVMPGLRIATERLSCPTANLDGNALQMPPYGVYAAITCIAKHRPLPGIIYIGDAPTIRGLNNGNVIIELHLFDFAQNIYGQEITVEPVKFLRGSKVFENAEELKRQIAGDIAEAHRALR